MKLFIGFIVICFVAAGPLQMPLVEAARLRGLRIVAVDANPVAPGMQAADSAFAIPLVSLTAAALATRLARP